MRNWRGLGLTLLLCTSPVAAQTDIYRSVDEQGVVQFSDTRGSDADEHFQVSAVDPAPETIDAHDRLMAQQLDLIALLEQSRQSRAQENFERRRQGVELARARLALEQERNAAAYAESGSLNYSGPRNNGYAYPVGYSYKYQRRQGHRYGHGQGKGQRPSHLPAHPGYGNRPASGRPSGHGSHGGSRTLSKPFITKGW